MAVTDAERQAVLDNPAIVEEFYQEMLKEYGGDRTAALQAVYDAQEEYGLDDSFVTANLKSVPADAYISYRSAVNVGFVPDKTPATVDTGVQAPAATPVDPRYQAVTDWLTNNPNATDAQIAAQMDATGYTPEEVAAATGMDVSGIQARYDAVTPNFDLATALRMNPDLGAAGIDTQEEFNQWYRDFGINDPDRQYTGFTDQQIKDYENSLLASGMSPAEVQAQVAAEGQKYGVDPTRVQDVLGYSWSADTGTGGTEGFTDQQIVDYLNQNPNLTDAEIVAAMDENGISVDQMARATGTNLADVQVRYDAVTGGTGGTTGTTGTGGIIGSQPTAEMLTPFQQAALAQNQALLGTMEASAGPFGRLATTDYNRYMNPYTTGVINTTMQDLERQRQMQQNDIGYQATRAGAFGGSRHGVAEALTNEAMQRTMANTAAQQRQAGFQQAQSAAQQDIGNEMTQRQFGLNAANQMGNLAAQSFSAGTSINDMLNQAGTNQQLLNQAQMDAAAQQAGAYQTYPATGAGTFSQILGAAPTGMNQTNNPGVMDYLTLGASGLGAAAQAGWISDIRVKKNITKIGELKNGVGIYTWDWTEDGHLLKSEDQPSYGVIAQEAMEVIPSAVTMASDGYYRVDYSHPELSGVA